MYKRIFLFCVIVLSIAACAVAYNKFVTHIPPPADYQVRSVVNGFGDVIGQVSLATTTEAVAVSMDRHYALYIHPDLLASWKAKPERALGKETLTEQPDRINIETVVKNADGTYSIDGVITARTSTASPSTIPPSVPVRFVLTQGPDGWQITASEFRPASR